MLRWILIVAIMPLIWGVIVYWMMSKLWPQGSDGTRKRNIPPPLDYQI